MEMQFSSKKSILFFLIITLIPLLIGVYLKITFGNLNLIITLVLILITLLHLYVFFFTHYIVNKDKLIVNIGLYTYKTIYLKDIKQLKEDDSISKSLATSTKNRIEIFYKDSSFIVSPKDKIGFLTTINEFISKHKIP